MFLEFSCIYGGIRRTVCHKKERCISYPHLSAFLHGVRLLRPHFFPLGPGVLNTSHFDDLDISNSNQQIHLTTYSLTFIPHASVHAQTCGEIAGADPDLQISDGFGIC